MCSEGSCQPDVFVGQGSNISFPIVQSEGADIVKELFDGDDRTTLALY